MHIWIHFTRTRQFPVHFAIVFWSTDDGPQEAPANVTCPHEHSDVELKSSQVTVSLQTGKLPILVDLFGDRLEGQTRYNAG